MILNEIYRVLEFVLNNFIKIWPLLLITIPLAVVIRSIKMSDRINAWLSKNIHLAIFIATFVGAVAPFCSCSVIPVISSMLIAGVPLAPVMSFWLASPSMDPEIFFLSAATLGYPLAIARIVATFLMSLAGGYVTYMMFGKNDTNHLLKMIPKKSGCECGSDEPGGHSSTELAAGTTCCSSETGQEATCCTATDVSGDGTLEMTVKQVEPGFFNRLSVIVSKMKSNEWVSNSISSVSMVVRFLLIAYILEAFIIFYVPESLITVIIGGAPMVSVLKSTALSVPLYTSTLSALGIIGGLMEKGLSGGAALAFLIGGATTTIPAMSAVYQLVHRKVFFIYLFMAVGFSLAAGILFNLLG